MFFPLPPYQRVHLFLDKQPKIDGYKWWFPYGRGRIPTFLVGWITIYFWLGSKNLASKTPEALPWILYLGKKSRFFAKKNPCVTMKRWWCQFILRNNLGANHRFCWHLSPRNGGNHSICWCHGGCWGHAVCMGCTMDLPRYVTNLPIIYICRFKVIRGMVSTTQLW